MALSSSRSIGGLLILVLSGAFQIVRAQDSGVCGYPERVSTGQPDKDAVITGKPFKVPELKLHFRDSASGVPLSDRRVIVRYVSEWFQYPYPENLFGTWSESYDLVKCTTGKGGTVIIMEREVTPNGWYNGKFLLGRKPAFKRLDISIETHRRILHYDVSRKELERQRKGDRTITFTAP